ncbi:response regulator [Caulobacter sp. 17J65-9]|uniref:response regulator n=1 Tax=Caulobacter sp. 17J65-9 TaxID=2709382 RepID=UPI0013CD3C73|nr:response regulator [Caulobacter sp. 17J65-9]
MVEDEADVCALIEDALIESGYSVDCVFSDAEAYAALAREPHGYSALIADINLREGTTGFDVARFARRQNADLPVIYVTGAATGTDAANSVADGAFLLKPFTPGQLVDAVRERLEQG